MKSDAKKKILLPIIILMLIFIGWQVYNIMRGKQSSSNNDGTIMPVNMGMNKSEDTGASNLAAATIKRLPTDVSLSPIHETSNNNEISSTKNIPVVQVKNTGDSIQLNNSQVKKTNEQVKEASISEEDALMHEYQELKKEEMLLNQRLAIAQAKQKINELNSKISSLGGTKEVRTSPVAMDKKPTGYRLVYVDYHDGQWAATLSDSSGSNLQEVVTGGKLPDGARVVSISAKGVTIQKGSKKMLLTFSGVTPLNDVVEMEADNQMDSSSDNNISNMDKKDDVVKIDKSKKTKKAAKAQDKKNSVNLSSEQSLNKGKKQQVQIQQGANPNVAGTSNGIDKTTQVMQLVPTATGEKDVDEAKKVKADKVMDEKTEAAAITQLVVEPDADKGMEGKVTEPETKQVTVSGQQSGVIVDNSDATKKVSKQNDLSVLPVKQLTANTKLENNNLESQGVTFGTKKTTLSVGSKTQAESVVKQITSPAQQHTVINDKTDNTNTAKSSVSVATQLNTRTKVNSKNLLPSSSSISNQSNKKPLIGIETINSNKTLNDASLPATHRESASMNPQKEEVIELSPKMSSSVKPDEQPVVLNPEKF